MTKTKTWKATADDLEHLELLTKALGVSEASVLRLGLRALAKAQHLKLGKTAPATAPPPTPIDHAAFHLAWWNSCSPEQQADFARLNQQDLMEQAGLNPAQARYAITRMREKTQPN